MIILNMNQELKTERKKTYSLQDAINIYMKMIPSPMLVKSRILHFQELKPDIIVYSGPHTVKNSSALQKIDKIVKSSSEALMKNSVMLKSYRKIQNSKGTNALTPASGTQSKVKVFESSAMRYKKIQSSFGVKNIRQPLLGVKKPNSDAKKISIYTSGFLSPSNRNKGENTKHKRKGSSDDFSMISISGWNAD